MTRTLAIGQIIGYYTVQINIAEYFVSMFESIGKKINLLMAREGISGMQLARTLGIPASTIKKIRSKEITNPTVATLAPIARYFSVTIEYLLEGMNEFNNSLHPPKQYNVPLISWEEAVQFPNIQSRPQSTVITERNFGAHAFALLVKQSDEVIFPLGSIIIIEPTRQIEHFDFVIVTKIEQPKVLLKQILYEEEKTYIRSLKNANNIFPFTTEYRLLGVVAEYRKYHRNSVRSLEN